MRPDFAEALIAVGKARAESKQYVDAAKLFERAVALDPSNEAARYNLMLAYRNLGRTADALAQKKELDRLQKPPEGEFTEFLKKLGEKAPQP
jgi:tetratricopeptide (TPR) repeat protein